jgi:hypothetical protein
LDKCTSVKSLLAFSIYTKALFKGVATYMAVGIMLTLGSGFEN